MLETLLIAGVLSLLVGLGLLAFVAWGTLLPIGLALAGIGLAFGVPAGVVYHVLLARALRPRGALPKNWVWDPIALHGLLRPTERRRVLPWCYAGGAGFVVIVVGFVVTGIALAGAALRG